MTLSSCRCCNSLAFPTSISLDEVQHVLYGRNLGLELPARDPWSYMAPDDIKSGDLPWLQAQFAQGGTVSVMERLAAYAGAHERGEGGMHFHGGPPPHAAMVRRPRAISFHAPAGEQPDDGDASPRLSLRGGAGVVISVHRLLCWEVQACVYLPVSHHKPQRHSAAASRCQINL